MEDKANNFNNPYEYNLYHNNYFKHCYRNYLDDNYNIYDPDKYHLDNNNDIHDSDKYYLDNDNNLNDRIRNYLDNHYNIYDPDKYYRYDAGICCCGRLYNLCSINRGI